MINFSRRRLSKLRQKLGRRMEEQSQRLVRFDSKVHNSSLNLLKPFRGLVNLAHRFFCDRRIQFFFGVVAGWLFWLAVFALVKFLFVSV
jgi:hypothetical protein